MFGLSGQVHVEDEFGLAPSSEKYAAHFHLQTLSETHHLLQQVRSSLAHQLSRDLLPGCGKGVHSVTKTYIALPSLYCWQDINFEHLLQALNEGNLTVKPMEKGTMSLPAPVSTIGEESTGAFDLFPAETAIDVCLWTFEF